ncbi:FTR1 family protein [Candidatus Woesearchaeota archaeon]|nr:FTR1 family protein [Candidatus Woesearchaeota archaeon]
MLASFIITFREMLEVALVVGIILSYLSRTKQTQYNNVVYLGVVSGIVASIIGAILFNNLSEGFEGTAEQIFEGVTMLTGALLLTTMIFWMMKQRHVAVHLEQKIAEKISEVRKYGLFSLVFVAVLREGIETVIFLSAASFVSQENNIIGALAGIVGAIILGYAIFVSARKINIRKFFNITSILLILFAAGLTAHGVHELQEAGLLPAITEEVWNTNPAQNHDGSYPLLHEKGHIGSVLKELFGYNGNPSLIEAISYFAYLTIIILLWAKIERSHGA